MELPLEILLIIREFSKPVFTHWKIFNEVKEIVDPVHFKALREALLRPKAVQICEELALYLSHCRHLQYCHVDLLLQEHLFGWRSLHSSDLSLDQKKKLSDAIDKKIIAQMTEASHYDKVMFSIYDNR